MPDQKGSSTGHCIIICLLLGVALSFFVLCLNVGRNYCYSLITVIAENKLNTIEPIDLHSQRLIAKLNVSASMNPIFTSRATELRLLIEAIRKKSHIYDLPEVDIVDLANDYMAGSVSEPFGHHLERNHRTSWKDVESEISGQFGSYISITEAVRALVEIRQNQEE